MSSSASQKSRYNKLKMLGICTKCGQRQADSPIFICVSCRKSQHEKRCKKIGKPPKSNFQFTQPRKLQIPGREYTFPCGCQGTLPNAKGQSNLFAVAAGRSWKCRIRTILISSKHIARFYECRPIDLNTPHSTIKKMMGNPICVLCLKHLNWRFGHGKTPHLHHDHETGEPIGFVHVSCNGNATEKEFEKIKTEFKQTEQFLHHLTNQYPIAYFDYESRQETIPEIDS